MKQIAILFLLTILISCSSDVSQQDVFSEFKLTKEVIPADGQSTAEAIVVLNPEANSDRRNVIFKITNGAFLSSTADPSTIMLKATYEEGRLIARTSFRSSTQPGSLTVTAQPEFDSPLGEFMQTTSIQATRSEAVSLNLITSSYGIFSNYLSEVQLTGTLRNADNKQVSNGHKVVFTDTLEDGSQAGGKFRSLQDISDATSKVSAFYSIGFYPIGTKIFISCYLLDNQGNSTSIGDQLILTINQ